MRCTRRSAVVGGSLVVLSVLLYAELSARPTLRSAPVVAPAAVPSPFAAAMPCTIRDAPWLVAKIVSCARTLAEHNVRLVLVMLPRRDLRPMRAALAAAGASLPAHWRLVPEDEILPRLSATPPYWPKMPGWNLQQALKLLARYHPLIARASPPVEYLLTLDSDVACALDWDDRLTAPPAPTPAQLLSSAARTAPSDGRSPWVAGRGGQLAPAPTPRASAFSLAFIRPDGRVRTCVERLAGWYGQRHLRMTALAFNFSGWLDGEGNVHRALQGAHVMGWTPQILSVRALAEVDAELVRRVPAADAPAAAVGEPLLNATFRRLAASARWTEYFTYYLALDALGRWRAYHDDECAAVGVRTEPASGRCAAGGALAAVADAAPAAALAALREVRGVLSSGVAGCLKVRADCVAELLLEVGYAAVPFVTINDHRVTGDQAVAAVTEAAAQRARQRATASAAPDRRSSRAPARACCAETHLLTERAGGGESLFPRPALRSIERACADGGKW
jgi:hypothetical protein